MLSRLRIGPKLLLAPGAVLLLLLVLSCAAYFALARQNASLESIVGQRAASMREAGRLAAQSQQAHAAIYRYLSWMGGSFPAARTEPLRQDILVQHRSIAHGLATLSRAPLSAAELRHIGQAADAQQRYAQAVREVIELAPLDGSISANAMQKAEAAFTLLAQRLGHLRALEDALSRQASSSAKGDFRMISLLMPALLLLAVGLSLAITLAVRRMLLGEIRGIALAASSLASGNLTLPERADQDYGNDEIATTSRLLDASIRNLNGTLRSIAESARNIGGASRDIKLSSLSLGSRAVYRASALSATESTLQALAAGVRHRTDDACAANRLAAGAGEVAQHSGSVFGRLVATLEASRGSAQRVVELVEELDLAASKADALARSAGLKAGLKVGLNDGLNTALNETLDPALASEVRALARRVAGASREIRAVAAQSVAHIEGGTAWALHAGTSMRRIASSVREVEEIVERIGAAGSGQAEQLQGVSQAIVQMDQVTRQNCTLVEEAANAARTLQMQALALSRTVAGFRLDDQQDSEPKAPQPLPARATGASGPDSPAAPQGPNNDGAAAGQGTSEAGRERRPGRERRRHPASHLRLASSRK